MLFMENLKLLAVLVLGAAVSACSSGAHSTASRPTYLAQAVFVDCKNSMECCIKKFPATAMESCGATSAEVAEVLGGGKLVNGAVETATLKGVDEPEREDDEGGREERPEWRQHCIDEYTRCVDLSWTGNCSACLERCKGQRGEWPTEMCGPPKSQRRR